MRKPKVWASSVYKGSAFQIVTEGWIPKDMVILVSRTMDGFRRVIIRKVKPQRSVTIDK